MGLFAWVIVGAVLGAAGTELLNSHKPEMIKRIEDAARRVVDHLSSGGSAEKEAEGHVDVTSKDKT